MRFGNSGVIVLYKSVQRFEAAGCQDFIFGLDHLGVPLGLHLQKEGGMVVADRTDELEKLRCIEMSSRIMINVFIFSDQVKICDQWTDKNNRHLTKNVNKNDTMKT